MRDFKGKTFVFLGRSGSGKGTQAQLLKKFLEDGGYDVIYIYTGDQGRKLAKENTLVGHWIKGVLERGDFFLNWTAIYLWFSVVREKLVNKNQIIIFDGTPRKLPEAEVVDSLMKDLGRSVPIPVYLDISNKEAQSRLLARGRSDDTENAISSRLDFFEKDVVPIIKNYGDRALKINGEGSVEEVWERFRNKIEK